ncbi:putative NADPH:adrenodoxin oxidoreductase [Paratrimastix pyriformis]|uniref:Cap-specific mRNA (nucleoside-2'-O-)-methyltransferase 2 n=1 Tax=Paratrimastix pyriformis TaxID=342808 RepID=A0ABQ8UJA4_9EUKA|nr:putative NADPH:adrenodoxin oxidoreductase [Paratrimastix pyriformis]
MGRVPQRFHTLNAFPPLRTHAEAMPMIGIDPGAAIKIQAQGAVVVADMIPTVVAEEEEVAGTVEDIAMAVTIIVSALPSRFPPLSLDHPIARSFTFPANPGRVGAGQLGAMLFADAPPGALDPEMQRAKESLNATKCELDGIDIVPWGRHTSLTNPAGAVVNAIRDEQAEMCTIAWCKMMELIVGMDLFKGAPQALATAHLCEAPGAFICATNHYIQSKLPPKQAASWEWTGLTLNPYHEGGDLHAMIDDDAFILTTQPHWYFGADNTGNIMHPDNVRGLWARVGGRAWLVTADGSVDCQDDPNAQESSVAPLHFCEAVAALGCLAPGGNFVLKMFTLFEQETAALLYMLWLLFARLEVCKPETSKPGNSEVYVVAKGFRGCPPALLAALSAYCGPAFPPGRSLLPVWEEAAFMRPMAKCAALFAGWQTETIRQNLRLFRAPWDRALHTANRERIARDWKQRMGFKPIRFDQFSRASPLIKSRRFLVPPLDGRTNNTGRSVSVPIHMQGRDRTAGGTFAERKHRREAEAACLTGTPASSGSAGEAVGRGCKWARMEDDQEEGAESGPAGPQPQPQQGSWPGMGMGSGMGGGGPGDQQPQPGQQPGQPSSVAERMMARMGHVAGQGLGAKGQGIQGPLEADGQMGRTGLGFAGSTAAGRGVGGSAQGRTASLQSLFQHLVAVVSSGGDEVAALVEHEGLWPCPRPADLEDPLPAAEWAPSDAQVADIAWEELAAQGSAAAAGAPVATLREDWLVTGQRPAELHLSRFGHESLFHLAARLRPLAAALPPAARQQAASQLFPAAWIEQAPGPADGHPWLCDGRAFELATLLRRWDFIGAALAAHQAGGAPVVVVDLGQGEGALHFVRGLPHIAAAGGTETVRLLHPGCDLPVATARSQLTAAQAARLAVETGPDCLAEAQAGRAAVVLGDAYAGADPLDPRGPLMLARTLLQAGAALAVGGGSAMVVRMGDCYARIMAGLVWVASQLFDEVALHRPAGTSPIGGARFLLARGFRGMPSPIRGHLEAVSAELERSLAEGRPPYGDVMQAVPMMYLLHGPFHRWLTCANESLGRDELCAAASLVQLTRTGTAPAAQPQVPVLECLPGAAGR